MSEPVTVAEPSAPIVQIEANLHGHITYVHRRHSSMVLWDEPALLLADSGLPSDTFNKVARAKFSPKRSNGEIARALAHFRTVSRPFAWWVGPSSRPLNIEERLQERGFRLAGLETGMRLELRNLFEPPAPDGLTVERVSSPAQLEDFSRVLAENWEPPDPTCAPSYRTACPFLLRAESSLRCFIGYLDGEPAAVSGLYLEGDAGGIYAVATRRLFGRLGISSRLTWAAAQEARRAGAVWAVLQASGEGKAIYERLGFQHCCHFAEYTPPLG